MLNNARQPVFRHHDITTPPRLREGRLPLVSLDALWGKKIVDGWLLVAVFVVLVVCGRMHEIVVVWRRNVKGWQVQAVWLRAGADAETGTDGIESEWTLDTYAAGSRARYRRRPAFPTLFRTLSFCRPPLSAAWIGSRGRFGEFWHVGKGGDVRGSGRDSGRG
jgi:hypothetical protein